jgi:PAS domain S-box-containing protein
MTPQQNRLLAQEPLGMIHHIIPLVLNHANKWIFVKDRDYKIVFANELFLKLYAPDKRDGILGTTTIESFPKEQADVFLSEDKKAFDTGYAELIEELTDYKGRKIHLQSQKIRFYDEQGNAFILGICHDITEHVLREKELAEKNLSLENFAAIAAHDLRSPLASCVSGIDFIEHADKTIAPQSMHILSMIKHTCKDLLKQIGGILTVYKNSAEGNLSPEVVDLKLLIEEIKFALHDAIQVNGATILSNHLPDVYADKTMFKQVISNLIENSIKYRSEQKPVIIIRCVEQDDHFLFSIEDNGVGIKEKDHETVFELYKQGELSPDGAGIGMSLCKKIIDLHQGTIWVDPNHRPGCKINFTIPVMPLL